MLNSTQIEQVVSAGSYATTTKDKNGESIVTMIETGYVTDMQASGGVCYVRVQKTDLKGKSFPKFADYYFTYARTNSQALEYFYTFNKMIDSAKAGNTTFDDNGLERSLTGYS